MHRPVWTTTDTAVVSRFWRCTLVHGVHPAQESGTRLRSANLVVLPLPMHQHPGLSALNRLNYVWSVPADFVIVVVGWTSFLFWGPFVL